MSYDNKESDNLKNAAEKERSFFCRIFLVRLLFFSLGYFSAYFLFFSCILMLMPMPIKVQKTGATVIMESLIIPEIIYPKLPTKIPNPTLLL